MVMMRLHLEVYMWHQWYATRYLAAVCTYIDEKRQVAYRSAVGIPGHCRNAALMEKHNAVSIIVVYI